MLRINMEKIEWVRAKQNMSCLLIFKNVDPVSDCKHVYFQGHDGESFSWIKPE